MATKKKTKQRASKQTKKQASKPGGLADIGVVGLAVMGENLPIVDFLPAHPVRHAQGVEGGAEGDQRKIRHQQKADSMNLRRWLDWRHSGVY